MIGEAGMPDRWRSRRGQSRQVRHVVALENVDSVGMALVLNLLEAGYDVVGRNVAAACLEEFRAAGGTPLGERTDAAGVAWTIECHERSEIHQETLSRLALRRQGYGRPRLELSGAGRAAGSANRDPVATLAIRRGRDVSSDLQVALDVSSRGLQLVVRGERPLFEAALPLLTVLADRVLYAGVERDNFEQASQGHPSRN